MKHTAHILLTVVAAWLLFCFFFFGMVAIIDSQFYLAFGHYLTTGENLFPQGYQYLRPTTVSPPLYGLLLILVKNTNILHAIQLLMLGLTGYFLYKSLRFFVSKNLSGIIASLFILYPTNTIYAHYLLTETAAQTAVAILTYLILSWTHTKKNQTLSLAIIFSAIMTLLKYSFFIYTCGLLILYFLQKQKKTAASLAGPFIGICYIGAWIIVNHSITGVWNLSDNRGGHLYNNVVWIGKLLPEKTHPSLVKLHEYVPPSVNLFTGYWSLQDYILPHVGNQWPVVDQILGNVAIAAIQAHPLSYIAATVHGFIALHSESLPYWEQVGRIGEKNIPYPIFCGTLSTFTTCDPLIHIPNAYTYWNTYIHGANAIHRLVFPLFAYVFLFPSIIYALIVPDTKIKLLALIYLFGVFPIAMLEHHDTRYLVPFYPLAVLLSTAALSRSVFRPRNRLIQPSAQ